MLPLLRLLPLHHGSRNEGAENRKEGAREEINREEEKKKEEAEVQIIFQLSLPLRLLKSADKQWRRWVGASEPGARPKSQEERVQKGRTGGREGGRRERKKQREIWRIDPSLHCHQEFISSWKGVKRGWKGQRWRMNTLPFTPSDPDDHLPVYLPAPPLLPHPSSPPVVFHPALGTSPPLLYLLSLLASPSPVLSFVFFLRHPLSLSSATPTHPPSFIHFSNLSHILSTSYPSANFVSMVSKLSWRAIYQAWKVKLCNRVPSEPLLSCFFYSFWCVWWF